MEKVNGLVDWYQKKIGTYDKQLWEKSVEQKIIKGIHGMHNVPRKSGKVKAEFIDVDLVRGSAFTKAKPQYSSFTIARRGLVRVFFLPFYYKWWRDQTSFRFWLLMVVLYILQIITVAVHVYMYFMLNNAEQEKNQMMRMSDIITPGMLLIILGIMHSQIVSTHASRKTQREDERLRKRAERSKRRKSRPYSSTQSEHESGSQEASAGITAEDSKASSLLRRTLQNEGVKLLSSQERRGSDKSVKSQKSAVAEKSESRKIVKKIEKKERTLESSEEEVKTLAAAQIIGLESGQDSDPVSDVGATGVDPPNRTEGPIAYKPIDNLDDVAWNTQEDFGALCMPTESVGEIIMADDCDFSNFDDALGRVGEGVTGSDSVRNTESESSRTLGPSLRTFDGQSLNNPNGQSLNTLNGSSNCPNELVECQNQECSTLNGESVKTLNGQSLGTFNGDIVRIPNGQSVLNEETRENDSLRTLDSKLVKTASVNGSLSKENLQRLESLNQLQPNLRRRTPASRESPQRKGSDLSAERSDVSSSCEIEVKHDSSIEADRLINSMADNESGGEAPPIQIRITNSQEQDVRSDSSSKRRYGSGQTVRRRRRSNLKVNINQESGKSSSKRKLKETLPVKVCDQKESTGVSSCDSEADTPPNTPTSSRKATTKKHTCNFAQFLNVRLHQTKQESSYSSDGPMSEAEWDRMNSDMATSDTSSCTSGSELSDGRETSSHDDPFYWSHGSQPSDTVVHNSHTPAHDKVSCYIWEGEECKKVDLTVLDIGWIIIEKVDTIPETADYLFLGFLFSFLLAFTPALFRLYHHFGNVDFESMESLLKMQYAMFGETWGAYLIMANGVLQRVCLSSVLFFLLSVAERTFKQRLWYAKHFCYLTSSRRARKYDLPHFRLNKVRNIKTWLSLRSYLKKRGPQRSVDVIVSAAFVLALTLVALMCVQLLKDTESFLDQIYNWELVVWSMTLGMYLLRFMTLGNKINKKYRNLSVLITEQINLYLHMEQKPHKKEELMLANNVLKLAEDLLKELESPFKISGLSANPFLYNITKVVILSAFSAVLTELLGFKLKLYKIKLRT